jgi:peptidylamidoglycolate lyase
MRPARALVVGFATGVAVTACAPETIAPVGERYEVVRGWPELPEGTLLGQVSGVGVDAEGGVLIFRRAARDWSGGPLTTDPIADPTIFRFDAETGALRTSFGQARFAMPHGLTVDPRGHLWLTDVALHQVFELDASGRVLLVLGEAGVPGNDATHFNMPTDVAVAEDGTFFVSDGYGNARVVRFGADGSFQTAWGEPGSAPGQFSVPHGISLGPDGNVYVADRGNARVQIFDRDGSLRGIWEGTDRGRPWSITVDSAGEAFVVDGGDQLATPPDRARIFEIDPHGAVVTSFGSYGHQDGEMIYPHDIAVDHAGDVYVVEVGLGRRAQKFRRR